MDQELESFKNAINLVEFAVYHGFDVIKEKSSKRSFVLSKNGQKIGISRHKTTGHDVFNVFCKGKGHGGTVIDFVQKIVGVSNFGEVRKSLRNYLGSPPPQVRYSRPVPRPTKEEQLRALQSERQAAMPLKKSGYLQFRGISQEILDDPRFRGMIHTDHRSNVLFTHINQNGFSGYEKKNNDFTGFSSNGEKGIWASRRPENFKKIVFCEAGIDALSHAQLYPDPTAAYVSLAGQFSIEQEELIESIIDRNPGIEFIAAFDNDKAGYRYTDDLKRLAGDRNVTIIRPVKKDWNDDLQAAAEPFGRHYPA